MKIVTILSVAAALSIAVAAEKKLTIQDLPTPAQKTAQDQLKNATLVAISTENEKGRKLYEIETKVNGKVRDVLIDATGKVVEVEDEVDIATIPAPARTAIEKKVGKDKLERVESLTKSAGIEAYEAFIKKGTKTTEYAVKADGSAYKD
jgi:uncharacterized membrane protein YkoI